MTNDTAVGLKNSSDAGEEDMEVQASNNQIPVLGASSTRHAYPQRDRSGGGRNNYQPSAKYK